MVEFACINDKALATAAEDMEYLYGEIDDKVIIEICKQRNILLPEDLREEEYEDEEPEKIEADEPLEEVDIYVEDYSPPPKRPGFFDTLFGEIAGVSMASGSNQHRHNGRCNGDRFSASIILLRINRSITKYTV